MSVITFLLPNVSLEPKQVERLTSALERIADSLERAYPSPDIIVEGRRQDELRKSRPSTADDFFIYDDKQAEKDYLDQLGETPPDTFGESPSFAMAHEEEFSGTFDYDGVEDSGLDPNGR